MTNIILVYFERIAKILLILYIGKTTHYSIWQTFFDRYG